VRLWIRGFVARPTAMVLACAWPWRGEGRRLAANGGASAPKALAIDERPAASLSMPEALAARAGFGGVALQPGVLAQAESPGRCGGIGWGPRMVGSPHWPSWPEPGALQRILPSGGFPVGLLFGCSDRSQRFGFEHQLKRYADVLISLRWLLFRQPFVGCGGPC